MAKDERIEETGATRMGDISTSFEWSNNPNVPQHERLDGRPLMFVFQRAIYIHVDNEDENENARTRPVLWSANGYRVRGFPEAARMQEVSEMDEKDFLLDGPRSSGWFITAMANSDTTPLQRHGK